MKTGVIHIMNENPSVTLFREYLRIKTVHPNPDYQKSTSFLIQIAIKYNLKHVVHEAVVGKPCDYKIYIYF